MKILPFLLSFVVIVELHDAQKEESHFESLRAISGNSSRSGVNEVGWIEGIRASMTKEIAVGNGTKDMGNNLFHASDYGSNPIEFPFNRTYKSKVETLGRQSDSFLYKFSIGLIFALIPVAVVLSFKNVCPEFDKSMNMRRILNSSKNGSHKFSRLASSDDEAEIGCALTSMHAETDQWDEFLGNRKVRSSSTDPYL